MDGLIIYGASWCADCRRSKQYLDSKSIKYEYVDIDTVPGASEKVGELNNGLNRIPTIVFPSGKIMVEPLNQELEAQLIIENS